MADFKDLPGRALIRTGTFNASTGEEVITDADLESIVAASRSGVLDNAVIKIGHQDPRYSEFTLDGDPAYGRVANLRVVDGVLYGDFLGVPADFAESLTNAFPHVSVELARNVKLRDQTGKVAHAFDVVLTAAALLGATPPAVKGLSQRAYAFSEDQLDYTTSIDFSEVFPEPDAEFAARKKAAPKAKAEEPTTAEETSGSGDQAQRKTTAPDTGDEPVAPTHTEANPTSEPAPEEKTGSETTDQAQNSDDTPDVPLRAANIAESSPEAPAPAPAPPAPRAEPNGVRTMPNIDEQAAALRKKYDLPDNASYKDVLQKVLEDDVVAGVQQNDKLDTRAGALEPSPAEVAEVTETETRERQKYNLSEGEAAGEAKVLTADLDDVYVSKSAFAALMEEFEATKSELSARKAAEVKAHRDELVTSWFRAGVIGKDERSVVREQLDVAEESVVALMERRTPIYPVVELGHAKSDSAYFALDTDETKSEALLKADDAIFGL